MARRQVRVNIDFMAGWLSAYLLMWYWPEEWAPVAIIGTEIIGYVVWMGLIFAAVTTVTWYLFIDRA